MSFSRSSCSSSESTIFKVETRCCASTSRQPRPESARASDDSAPGVQVVDDIHQSRHGLNQCERGISQSRVSVFEPGAGDRLIAAHNCVEGAVEPGEKDRQLECFLPALERVAAAPHAG